jgi:hypothetical protein
LSLRHIDHHPFSIGVKVSLNHASSTVLFLILN